jgi:hypothetical protein
LSYFRTVEILFIRLLLLLCKIIYQEKIKISLDFVLDKANLNEFEILSRFDSSTSGKSSMNPVVLQQETRRPRTWRLRRTRKMKRRSQT